MLLLFNENLSSSNVIDANISDIEILKNVLAKAFMYDPMVNWTVKHDEKFFIRTELMFETILKHFGLKQGFINTNEEKNACAVWIPPKKESSISLSGLSLLSAWIKIVGLKRMLKVMKGSTLVENAHPKFPCYYLVTLGVDPSYQNQGIASDLIKPVLDKCDKEGIPAYLETSNEDNLLFYKKHGFEIRSIISEPQLLPKTWTMIREPKNKRLTC